MKYKRYFHQNVLVSNHELSRTLKHNKLICIVTEAHHQIENRFYNKYFPSLIKNEKNRYPDIDTIIKYANFNSLTLNELQKLNKPKSMIISKSFGCKFF